MEIIKKSWFKRRKPTQEPEAVEVELEDYKQEHNHLCKMHVVYDNGERATYVARVVYNDLRDEWIVDGANVAVKL